jgi:predicted nucleic acid-binding protein
MPATECYLDTSTLLKLYVTEAFSAEVENYLSGIDRPTISSLTTLEWHCAMSRRQRIGAITDTYLAMARQEFMRHVSEGYFRVHSVTDILFTQALGILEAAKPVPLRTLDALHIAAARAVGAKTIATSDKIMAQAATKLGMKVTHFFQ